MQVQVKNRLPTLRAGVQDEAITLIGDAFLPGQGFSHQDHVSYQGLILLLQFIDGSNVPVGNNQNVNRGNGTDVMKGCHQVIPIDDPGRRFTGDDLAEGAIQLSGQLSRGHGIGPYSEEQAIS